jgi:hypothetical protein
MRQLQLFTLSFLFCSSTFGYVIGQKNVGESKTRTEFVITCGNGHSFSIMANADQLRLVESKAQEMCKNRGGVAKKETKRGVSTNASSKAPSSSNIMIGNP